MRDARTPACTVYVCGVCDNLFVSYIIYLLDKYLHRAHYVLKYTTILNTGTHMPSGLWSDKPKCYSDFFSAKRLCEWREFGVVCSRCSRVIDKPNRNYKILGCSATMSHGCVGMSIAVCLFINLSRAHCGAHLCRYVCECDSYLLPCSILAYSR